MVFSSTIFLFLFLPVFFAIYFIVPAKLKNVILLCFSLLFYTWGEDILVLLLIASTIVDYSCAIIIENGKRKLGLYLSIFFNLSILLSFKYLDFTFQNYNYVLNLLNLDSSYLLTLPNIALPIGISFFTFQTMSYTIDVYRNNVKANRNLLEFATYVTMFPQLVAGPIIRYIDVKDKLAKRTVSFEQISEGIERFIIGLGKKVLIANTFAAIADSIFSQNIDLLSTHYAWIGIIAYSFQIYFDFSGYSDMAIGIGLMLGFRFPENFNFPYISKSIQEFWRRWHISLSSWFKDYVYISLGGNRRGSGRTYINLLIVFFVTGMWHGASWNFIVWGMFHGGFLVLERLGFITWLSKLNRFLQHAYVILVVIVGWVLFRAETLGDALLYLSKMFYPTMGSAALNSYLDLFHINLHTLLFTIIALAFSVPLYNRFNDWILTKGRPWIKYTALLFLFAITIIYLVADTYNPFIYFRF